MIKIALNVAVPSNSAFFDPVSRVHLTLASPLGTVNELTPAVLKGIKFGTLLDVDHVVDLTNGSAKAASAAMTMGLPEGVPIPDEPENMEPEQSEPSEETKTTVKKTAAKKATATE